MDEVALKERVRELWKKYPGGNFHDMAYLNGPNCYAAALYVLGITSETKALAAVEAKRILSALQNGGYQNMHVHSVPQDELAKWDLVVFNDFPEPMNDPAHMGVVLKTSGFLTSEPTIFSKKGHYQCTKESLSRLKAYWSRDVDFFRVDST